MSGKNKPVSASSYVEMSAQKFSIAKTAALAAVDLSKKGSVDEPIRDLIRYINNLPQYFTTSSCSGRTIVVADGPQTINKKKGCQWLYVTHGDAQRDLVFSSLKTEPLPSTAAFKFEPFIMHVQCCDIASARQMLRVAIASGYRNSGLSLGKSGKIILAVRSTAGLEVPLIDDQRLLVGDQYIEFLVDKANEKMSTNISQISRFLENIKHAGTVTGSADTGSTAPIDLSTKKPIDLSTKKPTDGPGSSDNQISELTSRVNQSEERTSSVEASCIEDMLDEQLIPAMFDTS